MLTRDFYASSKPHNCFVWLRRMVQRSLETHGKSSSYNALACSRYHTAVCGGNSMTRELLIGRRDLAYGLGCGRVAAAMFNMGSRVSEQCFPRVASNHKIREAGFLNIRYRFKTLLHTMYGPMKSY